MNKEILTAKIKDEVLDSMARFMLSYNEDGEEPPYTQEDIDTCESILKDYVEALFSLTDKDDDPIMSEVEKVVIKLNELNEELDYSLIETEERESIAIFIQECAVICGLKNIPDDVTEEWREW